MNRQTIRVVEWEILQTFNCVEIGNIVGDILDEIADDIGTGKSILKPSLVKLRTTYFRNRRREQEANNNGNQHEPEQPTPR